MLWAMTDVRLELGDERLVLLPERAALRERDATLFVADVHIGKAAAFRVGGIAIPTGTTATTLDRLDATIARTGARRLVILGDFLHARAGRQPRTEARVGEWRVTRPDLQIELVRGNHDRMAGDPDRALNIIARDAPVVDGGLVLLHHPGGDQYHCWLAGHVHPGVDLVGPARQRLFLPCFHLTGCGLLLPAFGTFTGLAPIAPSRGDRGFAVAGDEVIEISPAAR